MRDVEDRVESIKNVRDIINEYLGGPPDGYSEYFIWTIEDNEYSENPYLVTDEDPLMVIAINNGLGTIWRGYEPESVVIARLHTRTGDYFEWSRDAFGIDGRLYMANPYGDRKFKKHSGRKAPALRKSRH